VKRSFVIAAAGLSTFALARAAAAHSGGQPGGGCVGCHASGNVTMSMSSSPAQLSPGGVATFTVTIGGPGVEAGLFIDSSGVGQFSTLGGQGLAEVNAGLTHVTPKNYSGGQAQFSFQWTAPAEVGAVRFAISGVSSNNNGSSGGDAAGDDDFDFVYGCNPQTFWRDLDGDGYGRNTSPLIHCAGAPPPGYAATGDDCDDNRDTTYPGAIEYCNLRDDDCDGEIDNDALPLDQYPDADRDGYYSLAEYQSGETILGCEMLDDDWASEPGDCQPFDASIHPGVEEVCNLFDDNCDGDVDERVRPQCGEGWCRREAYTCDEATCEPGDPMEETCNLFDDDCDGVVDNDAPCPEDEVCLAGLCQPGDGVGTDEGGPDAGDAAAGGEGTGTGGTGSGGAVSSGGGGCHLGGRRSSPSWAWCMLLLALRRRRA
jgi:uncharacterized membrane protein YgcG